MLRLFGIFILCLASVGHAQTGPLDQSQVTLRILTWDETGTLTFESNLYTAKVGPLPEFGPGREGRIGIDVVPVEIDIGPGIITFDYAPTAIEGAGNLSQAVFNGYELTFDTCVQFIGVTVGETTGIAVPEGAAWADGQRLFVNVQGLSYTAQSSFSVAYFAIPCPAT